MREGFPWKIWKDGKSGKDTFLILLLSGILLFVIAWPVNDKKTSGTKSSKDVTFENTQESKQDKIEVAKMDTEKSMTDTDTYITGMEHKLENILSTMSGVGRVKVMLTLKTTGEKIVEKDQPENRSIMTEKDGGGGSRNTNEMANDETTVYITDESGKQIPYVIKELEPVVEGVIVVAEGGENPTVNKNITAVVQALFDIEAHRIVVVKMKS